MWRWYYLKSISWAKLDVCLSHRHCEGLHPMVHWNVLNPSALAVCILPLRLVHHSFEIFTKWLNIVHRQMFIVLLSWNSGKIAVARFSCPQKSWWMDMCPLRSGDMSAKLSPKRTSELAGCAWNQPFGSTSSRKRHHSCDTQCHIWSS